MNFSRLLADSPIHSYTSRVNKTSVADVKRILASPTINFDGFLTLISPATVCFLEPMAQRARAVTRERFGRVIQMYAPVYASNECINSCPCCSFHKDNTIRRTTFTLDKLETEVEVLWRQGFRSLLLVSGEAPRAAPLGLHALWLQKTYWETQVCVSFPGLRQAAGASHRPCPSPTPSSFSWRAPCDCSCPTQASFRSTSVT